MSAHTKGPWHFRPLFGRDTFAIFFPDGAMNRRVDDKAGGFSETDARLISASPDLLEALKNLENDDESIPSHAWEMVKKAIAKATGEKA